MKIIFNYDTMMQNMDIEYYFKDENDDKFGYSIFTIKRGLAKYV